MQKGVFAFALLFIFGIPGISSAQTDCLTYPSNSSAPSGYGVSWDVTTPGKELLVKSNCPTSGNSIDITIGKGETAQYIWSKTYLYNTAVTPARWDMHTLSGTIDANGWVTSGSGTKTVTTPHTPTASNPMYFVGYVCTFHASVWKCGCANISCTSKHWQLQAYKGNGGGTGTGGTTGEPLPADSYFSGEKWRQGTGESRSASPSNFASVLQSANPGDTIVLAPGNYAGITISKSGSAAAPIFITASKPAVTVTPTTGHASKAAVAERSSFTGTMNINGSYLVIDGLFFGADAGNRGIYFGTASSRDVLIRNSHFDELGFYGIYLYVSGSNRFEHIGIFNNLFTNMTPETGNSVKMDYGIAAYLTQDLEVTNNIFDGIFHHSISLKSKNLNSKIINNYLKGCGQKCLDIGQSQDGQAGVNDHTGENLLIKNNQFISAHTQFSTSHGKVAAHLRNIRNIQFVENTFSAGFSSPIQVNFVRQGGDLLENVTASKLGQHGPVYAEDMLIEKNRFSGGTISLTGRGRGTEDVIVVKDNTGSANCNVGVLDDGGVDASYIDPNLNRAAPTVQHSGNPFNCN